MSEKRITIFASSSNSTSVSSDKSNFVYTFNPPLQVPRDKNPHIQLVGAEVYWNVPNVTTKNLRLINISLQYRPNYPHEKKSRYFRDPRQDYSISLDIFETPGRIIVYSIDARVSGRFREIS